MDIYVGLDAFVQLPAEYEGLKYDTDAQNTA